METRIARRMMRMRLRVKGDTRWPRSRWRARKFSDATKRVLHHSTELHLVHKRLPEAHERKD